MSTFVLVPGMWLGGWAWDGVADAAAGGGARRAPGDADRRRRPGRRGRAGRRPRPARARRHRGGRRRPRRDPRWAQLRRHAGHDGGRPDPGAGRAGRLCRQWTVGRTARGRSTCPTRRRERDRDRRPVPSRPWEPADDPVLLAGLDDDAIALLKARATTHPYASIVGQPVDAGAAASRRRCRWSRARFRSTRCARCVAAAAPVVRAAGRRRAVRAADRPLADAERAGAAGGAAGRDRPWL